MPTPSNLEIAEIFLRIGDMMDYLDENTFKTRSYWSAAETLRQLDEPVAEMSKKGELVRIRGVGEAIEGKIDFDSPTDPYRASLARSHGSGRPLGCG
jgi:DNA polymerase/3'-5' exonuclease PolX